MPLTTRLNGTGAPNLITSAWFNDFKDVLTGTMKDQNVLVQNNLTIKALGVQPDLSLMTATPAAGAGMGTGLYYYVVTFTSADGESTADTVHPVSVTTTGGNNQVALASIPTGPTGTTGRKIYRTVVGGSGNFLLCASLTDNITTTCTDTLADGSLGVTTPTHSTFGGAFYIKDSTGAVVITVNNDGYVTGATLVNPTATGAASLDGGLIVTDGSGNIVVRSLKTYTFTTPGVGTAAQLSCTNAVSTTFSGLMYSQSNGFGVKTGAGTKLMEIKNNGNMIISGSQYQTSAGSISTVSGQSFDSFDVAEVYESDQNYDAGTVLCPGNNNKLTKCLHDNCPCAVIVSPNPGLLLGQTHDDSNTRLEGRVAVALAGRVLVKTAMMMSPRTFVTTDGRGAIRPMQPGEEGYSLGFTLNETFVDNHVPQVGIFIRPAFVRVPK